MATDMIARAMAMGKADLVDGKVPSGELPETSIDDLSDTAIDDPENGEVLKYDADQGKWVNGTASGGGGTSDYTDLTNKPKINNVTLSGSKTGADLGLVDAESGKGLSTNDFTDAEKTKLSGIGSGAEANVQADWEQSDDTADDYIKNKPTIPAAQVNADWDAVSGVAQILNKPTIPTVNDATLTVQKNGASVGTFTANASSNATINITVPTSAADVSALPASTKYGASITLSIDSSTYVVTATLKDQDGNTLGSAQTIDLPLETMVVSGSYDDQAKKIVLTLKNGQTVEFSVADLVAGLQSEITAQSPLDADLVDDSTSTNKFVTAADKTAWNAKSDFSGSYDDLTDKPTIPAAQVNADWDESSGVAQILHKPTLGAAAAKGVDSSPTTSSTNLVESGGVASALAGKQATLTTAQQAAVDSGITSAKVGQYDKDSAATSELVDSGAKNLVDVRFSSRAATSNMPSATNNGDGSVTINGTRTGSTTVLVYDLQSDTTSSTDTRYTLPAGRYVVAATGSANVKLQVYAHDGTNIATPALAQASTDPVEFEYDSVTKAAYPYIDVRININGSASGISYDNVKFYPMICTKAQWDVSQAYAPYCPSMAELYARTTTIYNAIFGLGNEIPDGSDLDNYTISGVYYCQNSTHASTITNKPIGGSGFRMEVCYAHTTSRPMQKFIKSNTPNIFYVRSIDTSGAWTAWYQFDGTAITP